MKKELPEYLIGLGVGFMIYPLTVTLGWTKMILFMIGIGFFVFGMIKKIPK